MEENVIFNPKKVETSPITPKEDVSSDRKPDDPVASPPPPIMPDDPRENRLGEMLKKIPIKIVAAIVVLVLIVVFGVTFILPRFFSGSQKPVTLTYWGLWEDKPVMQAIINEFESANPNIKIDFIKKDGKQYRESLVTRIKNGNGPDLFRYHNSWLPAISSYTLPLSEDVIKASEIDTLYPPVVKTDLVRNGAIYGVPLSIDTLTLFVNTEIFDEGGVEVPKTWNDFVKVAKTLTVKDEEGVIKTAGAGLGTTENVSHFSDIVSLLMVQNGTDLYNIADTSANTAQALEFYANFAKGENNVWDDSLDNSITAFAKGDLAMYFGYSWDIFTIKAINPTLPFTTHAVPTLPGRSMTIASYWVEGISSKSIHKNEALLFMKFLALKSTQQKLYTEQAKTRLFGELYARKDLRDSLKTNPLLSPFASQSETAVSTYFASDTYDNGLNTHANTYLKTAVEETAGNTSGLSAAETLSEGVTQVFGQYGSGK